ncbi:Histidine phosphatase superfamily (branch 1), putative [Trypanosoma equiperdum]|uniref:Uncharacterized protein n=2 Tax=Trypanozoon TaxID=39700 RepID=Q385X8_TRYB2|nr:hypothetical protein, conserved [Trypanosoma brucei brucei TREU927]EAN79403.1 hypothetical protein, conserved [Trypanosoma brucei brucei TREU927]SCU70014.1 Histidine phosphatase superfamily (branch 1), putative [Trypanosoma equiperdum]
MTSVQYALRAKRRSLQWHQTASMFRDEVLLLRHGERLDHVNRNWKSNVGVPLSHLPNTDPPLSTDGRWQALETGLFFRQQRRHAKIRQRELGMLSMLLTSPFHRCLETAIIVNITGFDGKLVVFVDPLLGDWQSSRLYSHAPGLGGSYDLCGDSILFCPHWESLHASLSSFFRTAACKRKLDGMRNLVDETTIAGWVETLDGLYNGNASFLLWTSPSVRRSLHQGISCGDASISYPSDRRGGYAPCRSITNNGIAVKYPEGPGCLLLRAAEVVRTHFSNDTDTPSSVPRCVWEAAQGEAKGLPRTFRERSSLLTLSMSDFGPQPFNSIALLPPTRTMIVTHADVVSALLKQCCPKSYAADRKFSVPCCSISYISRSNDFYRGERGTIGTKEVKEDEQAPPVDRNQEWDIGAVGSFSHLQSATVLQYT